MARFGSKLGSFSISELMELLEDDEKLNKIVEDVDEVRTGEKKHNITSFSLILHTCLDFNRTIRIRKSRICS